MKDYIYLGDRFTDVKYKNQLCDAVRNNGKCIRSKLGTMLVSFNGSLVNVIARRLRKLKTNSINLKLKEMQEKEFDKLMSGAASKLAFIPPMMPLNKVTSDFVKANEVPTPRPMVKAVDLWIDRCKKLGMSERNIRKSVLRKFNIKLVKESPQE